MRFLFFTGFFILVISSSNLLHCKDRIYEGYIITKSNDTIYGFVDYTSWKKNPKEILFKKTKTGTGLFYSPTTVIEIKAGSNIFKSAIVKVDQDSRKKNMLSISPDFYYIVDTIYLRAILLGNKELYMAQDSTGQDNFYIKKDDNYIWLMYKKFLRSEGDDQIVTNNNYYIGQLIQYLNECYNINPILSETEYNYNDLIRSFLYYYDCTGTELEYWKDDENKNAFQQYLEK